MAAEVGEAYTRNSGVDDIPVTVTRQINRDIYAERWGCTVVIQYGAGGDDGGFAQLTPLEEVTAQWVMKQRKPKKTWKKTRIEVETRIPRENPYWSRLANGVLHPTSGRSLRITSDIDRILSILLLEDDFSVSVRRLHKTVKLLGP